MYDVAAERIEAMLNEWRKSLMQIEACLTDCPWWAVSRRKAYERNKEICEAYTSAIDACLTIVRTEHLAPLNATWTP